MMKTEAMGWFDNRRHLGTLEVEKDQSLAHVIGDITQMWAAEGSVNRHE